MRKAPHEWPDVETLCDNNFRNMFARDQEKNGLEAARKDRDLSIDLNRQR